MVSRRTAAQADQAAITRRRLELLGAELAALRNAVPGPGPDGERPDAGPPDGGWIDGGRTEDGRTDGHPTPEPEPRQDRDDRRGQREPEVVDGSSQPGRHARRPVGPLGRLAGWAHDRLPPTLQGRVALSAAHLSVVALLVAAGFAVTAWWVVRSDDQGQLVTSGWSRPDRVEPADSQAPAGPSPQLVTPAAEASAAAAAAQVTTGTVVVDVAGKVRRPGIVTLPAGARVVDAIEAAGGARPGVDLTPLNLARVLGDGEQIVVGVPPPAGVAASSASAPGAAAPGALVNINSASQAELEELPGVGPVTAQAILQWRSEHGPFTAVDELLEVSGIGEATLAEMAPHVTL